MIGENHSHWIVYHEIDSLLGSHTGRLESNSASHSALSSAALSASLFFVFKHKLDRVGDSNSISIVCWPKPPIFLFTSGVNW